MTLQLLNYEGEYQTYAEFHHEAFRLLLQTPFKLATSLHHYHPTQPLPEHAGGSRVQRLRLVKGERVALPCCVKLDQTAMPLDLQLCCAVALVPCMPATAGRKIRADQCCTDVKVQRRSTLA